MTIQSRGGDHGTRVRRGTRRTARAVLGGISLLALCVNTAAAQAAQDPDKIDAGRKHSFEIAAQPLSSALTRFAQQAGVEVLFPLEGIDDVDAQGIEGRYDTREALDRLLKGSDLDYSFTGSGKLVLRRTAPADERSSLQAERRTRLAQLQESPERKSAVPGARERIGPERVEEEELEALPEEALEEIVVTGTNIRGIAPESSPVRIFGREDILKTGAGTAADFIRTLPQNFGGGADESFRSLPAESGAGNNIGNGSTVNLRGLGAGSTLVLLNGRRVAPASDTGGFVDISMIPASAIERVEVLTDGASSIYGADAVAGVTNFVLRDDFEGAEVSLRYGTVTQGDLDEYRANLTGGTSWGSGNGLIVYEYYNRDNLSAGDRDFSDEFLLPNDLLPTQERHSALGSLSQELLPNLSLDADILYSRRESERSSSLLVGPNPGGATEADTTTENFSIGGDIRWDFAEDWSVDIIGQYSQLETDFNAVFSDGFENTLSSASDLWSVDTIFNGKLIDLPAGDLRLAVGGQYRRETFVNNFNDAINRDGERNVYAAFGEAFIPIVGPDMAVPGIRRLELNVSGRFEDYSDFGSSADPKVGLLYSPLDGLRFRGTYSTSFRPPSIGQTGALDRGANVLGTAFINDILGVEPADPSIADVIAIFPFGTAADLDAETSRAFSAGFDYEAEWGQHRFSISSTYFDIEFEGRLGRTPIPGNVSTLLVPNIAFDAPELFPPGTVTFFPSQDEIDAELAAVIQPLFVAGDIAPEDASIISRTAVVRNLSRTEVRGIDFDLDYALDTDFGQFNAGLDGTYLIGFAQQASATSPLVEQLDTLFNPLDLNLRGSLGYARGGFAAAVFVNYADDYRVDSTEDSEPIDSWTTIDVSLSYNTQEGTLGPVLDNTTFRLTVLNLLDENPPATPPVLNNNLLGFDPTNASPLNRFVAFEITKAF